METVPLKLDIHPKDLDWLAETLKLPETLSDAPALEDLLSSLPALTLEEWPAGREVLREGEGGDDFFVVHVGALSVWRDARELGRLQAGDFFGEIGFLMKSARSATVRTETKTRLFRFPAAEFSEMLTRHQALDRWVRQVACSRIQNILLEDPA